MSRSHGLLRLSEKIFNTPQYMSQETFERLTGYITDRNTGELAWQLDIGSVSKTTKEKNEEEAEGKILALNPLKANSFKRPDFSSLPEEQREDAYQEYLDFIQYDPSMKLGILNIEGTTVYRSTPFEALCGMTSYQRLERTMKAQLAEGAKTVLMYVDSGGGEAYGMIETAQNLRNLADQAGAKIIAYVDGSSGSAAYGLTAVAHEVIANPSSRVGSIGVVVSLMNNSKQLEKDGLERIYLYKGDNKVALDKDGNFSESFLKTVEDMVAESYQDFTSHVASNRAMTQQDVINTQATVFTASAAKDLGLVDKLMTRSEFFGAYLMTQVGEGHSNNNTYKMVAKAIPIDEVKTKMDIQDIETQANASQAPIETPIENPIEGAGMPENFAGDLADLQATVTALEERVLEKEKAILELTARAESAEKALNDYKHDQKLTERKESLSTVLASDKVEASLAFAEKLSDEDFQSYLGTLQSIYTASKESMTEIGSKIDDDKPAESYEDVLSKSVQKANARRA